MDCCSSDCCCREMVFNLFETEFESYGFSRVPKEDAMRAVRFMLNYAEDHSIILRGLHPGRPPFAEVSTWKLPSSTNKATVWGLYKDAVKKLGAPVVELIHFKSMWEYFLPQIVSEEPQTDLCLQCHHSKQKFREVSCQFRANRLAQVGTKHLELENLGLELCKISRERHQHADLVKKENFLYQEMNAKCGMICEDLHLSLGPSRPASRKITMSYNFDFAQEVHYPSDPQHPGPMYFFIPRKCQLFGVCCGGMPKQVSYIIDEGMLPKKSVINLMHHFFNNYGVGETCANLNSSAQNRINCLLWYCAWRMMHRLHLKLDLHFRITGHDLSGPDLLFGLVKQAFRKTRVQTLSDIAGVVRDSTPDKQLNIPQLVGLEDGTVLVETYDWNQHLCTRYFRPFPHIERYRHFSFDAQRPGMVVAKEHRDAEPLVFQLLHNPDVRPSADIPVQTPPGVSWLRQRYLFDKIRKFCSDEVKDIICPPPKAPRKKTV